MTLPIVNMNEALAWQWSRKRVCEIKQNKMKTSSFLGAMFSVELIALNNTFTLELLHDTHYIAQST